MSGTLDGAVAQLASTASALRQACVAAEAWRDDQRTQFERSTVEPIFGELRRVTATLMRAGAEIDEARRVLDHR